MLKVFDYRCTRCSYYETDRLVSAPEKLALRCPKCDAPMVHMPPATRTTFKFADRRFK